MLSASGNSISKTEYVTNGLNDAREWLFEASGGGFIVRPKGRNNFCLAANTSSNTISIKNESSVIVSEKIWVMEYRSDGPALKLKGTEIRLNGITTLSSSAFTPVGFFNKDSYKFPIEITFNNTNVVMDIRDTTKSIPKPTSTSPEGAVDMGNPWLTYTTLTPGICTISNDGKITPISAGRTSVQVKNKITKAQTSCTVTVIDFTLPIKITGYVNEYITITPGSSDNASPGSYTYTLIQGPPHGIKFSGTNGNIVMGSIPGFYKVRVTRKNTNLSKKVEVRIRGEYGVVLYKGDEYDVYVPEFESKLSWGNPNYWTEYAPEESNKRYIDWWKVLTGLEMDDSYGEPIKPVNINAPILPGVKPSQPFFSGRIGLFGLFTGVLNALASATSYVYVQSIFLSSSAYGENPGDISERRLVIKSGNSNSISTYKNYAGQTNIPIIDFGNGLPYYELSDDLKELYKALNGPKQDCGYYNMFFTIDQEHKSDGGYTGYIWFSNDNKVMETPIYYPGDKIRIGCFNGLLMGCFNRHTGDNIDFPLNTNSYEADERHQKLLSYELIIT